jgi:hypothetical protein
MTDGMMGRTGCRGTNAAGHPCEALVTEGELCFAHRAGGVEQMRAIAALGGAATRAKYAGQAFDPTDLPPIVTLEDAKRALDAIRMAVLTRRITHAEGNAASKAIDSWVKTETAAITSRLVNELRVELETRTTEIAELRKRLAGGRAVRMAR